jgi:hypothetical protein
MHYVCLYKFVGYIFCVWFVLQLFWAGSLVPSIVVLKVMGAFMKWGLVGGY